MKFCDIFSGLGGFHVALKDLGHTCVFACEIDHDLRLLYQKNFGVVPAGDLRVVAVKDIPSHDILCAGFPCQPFSKAGDQTGLDCPKWGDLIEYVVDILNYHKPRFFILENVPNLIKHNSGRTWKLILRSLRCKGLYDVDARVLSPHQFGVPQVRKRVFIVGSRGGLQNFVWPMQNGQKKLDLSRFLDKKPRNSKRITKQLIQCLEVWQEFLNNYPKHVPLPTFPIWSMEFGQVYPYVSRTPFSTQGKRSWKPASLPSHARAKQKIFPAWKIEFIRKNRELYRKNKEWLDEWLPKIRKFPPSLQKFEWNCNSHPRNIWRYLIQIRASGVRVKTRNTAPSLVAMTTTQVPIVAWEKRYMTPEECARLQSLKLKSLPDQYTKAFRALGNAVNAHLVFLIAKNLVYQYPRTISKHKQARAREGQKKERCGNVAA